MNRHSLFSTIVASVLLLLTPLGNAIEVDGNSKELVVKEESTIPSAIEYLQLMQKSYQIENYEILYLSSLQKQLEPMQLIHGIVDGEEASYFRYLNGVIRESLQYAGKISYFEQGRPAYTIESGQNRSVFANIANFDYVKGKQSYDYVILGKGRIAGKQSIAIRMISKDDYRYSYVVWCDLQSALPLRLDTINKSNVVVEQIMVMSLNVSESSNPWLAKLTTNALPETVHIPESTTDNSSQWKTTWLPTGFSVIKDDQHRLVMHENEPVSYILLDDGIVNVSIYISEKKLTLEEPQKLIRRGATVLYTEHRGEVEINVVGDIPVATAQRLAESIKLVTDDH
ncbi:MucB/RseB C-terminal domain-containing protein [Psychromonas sp. Urea-02u-13]|uniref:MucB/RseB C-terminal domain-containing protein n=1 Tax=Psychromonas sp. Urea-02u-13 TaxID=2058326 RepID=UPI000C32CB44|nr:MucB/RseB C-terminal domain-containing protein [Psychromonas sp. Urea-02u-13]PKG38168.1 transcriptional regulator [Psychromonas sp. Urea-02u-13]